MSNDLKYYGSVSLVIVCAFIGVAIVPNTGFPDVVKNALYLAFFAAAVFFAVCAVRAGLAEHRFIKSLNRNSVRPGIYRHFKGNIYHVLGVAENTETRELTVVYVPQRGVYAGELSNRSLRMFLEHVQDHPEAPGYSGPRFTLVEECDFIIKQPTLTISARPRLDTVV